MPFQRKITPNSSPEDKKTYVAVDGLDDFIKVLEKDFFAEVKFQCNYHIDSEKTDLILNIYCNFGLTESLYNFNIGNWGGLAQKDSDSRSTSSFDAAFQKLSTLNNDTIDIAELSVHFKDTSIVTTRIHDYSIPEKLQRILSAISKHFVYFTKGLTDMPYEIFVPVFEYDSLNLLRQERNYFDYWGLYFENDSVHDAMVYNLHTKKMCEEDFFLMD
ncbi:hypothetical protein HME9304_03378 [Flagellimonas maritima]|uniref:Uncharacterized protein n=1 Tax=Flagellimonas maritima TaxID=1383885 RepID=A0A2Z4LWH7_9FLAO|nr:hypothetical protein [Allomuricauda aurantiaca]AWX46345.1 hypothetical protein HME9304_03378 [Allomuricauda aurantiaca]